MRIPKPSGLIGAQEYPKGLKLLKIAALRNRDAIIDLAVFPHPERPHVIGLRASRLSERCPGGYIFGVQELVHRMRRPFRHRPLSLRAVEAR